jgi:5,10-methylenetetrahydrofolate reductase
MNLPEMLERESFCLVAEVEPPRGADLAPFVRAATEIGRRVDALAVSDGSHAIMRMTPLAPCRMLVEDEVDPIMILNGRDRNRISFQGDLLAAWALGVRTVIVTQGQSAASGDQPLARSSRDLDLGTMARAVACLNSGTDLGREALDGATGFAVGAAIGLPVDAGRDSRAQLGSLADAGVRFVVLDPTYDLAIVESFVSPAAEAGIHLLGSVMLLRSVAAIRYLNHVSQREVVPAPLLERMTRAGPRSAAGMQIAAELLRDLGQLCSGAVLSPVGWGTGLPAFLDLVGRGERAC